MFIIFDIFRFLSRYRFKLIVLFAAAVWGAVWVWPRDSNLSVIYCSVGQGDASILSRGFTQVLIDSGPSNPKTADCLGRHLPFFDRRLEAVIISHPQADHFAGLPEVLNRYQVDKFIFNGYAGDSRSWAELSRLVETEGSQIVTLAAGDKLKIGEIEIDVLWPSAPEKSARSAKISSNQITDKSDKSDLSDLSAIRSSADLSRNSDFSEGSILGVASSRDLNADALVLALSYGDFSALFTGDIGKTEEIEILGMGLEAGFPASMPKPIFRTITVLKVAHHGSKTSSSSEFLEAVRPALAVIEVGKNSYGHPADEVIKRLNTVGAKVLRTDKDGDVIVKTDGKSWQVSNGF